MNDSFMLPTRKKEVVLSASLQRSVRFLTILLRILLRNDRKKYLEKRTYYCSCGQKFALFSHWKHEKHQKQYKSSTRFTREILTYKIKTLNHVGFFAAIFITGPVVVLNLLRLNSSSIWILLHFKAQLRVTCIWL